LLSGDLEKCQGPFTQTVEGTFSPQINVDFTGEGTAESAANGGACEGVPFGIVSWNLPGCPPETRTADFTSGTAGGGDVGVNDGDYNVPNTGTSGGNESGYQRDGQHWKSGNVWADCDNTTQSGQYQGGGYPQNCDECENCGYNSGGRGVQFHPDGTGGGNPQSGENCADGTSGCFGVYGDEQGGNGGTGNSGAGGFADALNSYKDLCPSKTDIPVNVSTSPDYSDSQGNPTNRTGSNRYGCPSGGRNQNPRPPGPGGGPAPGNGWGGPYPPGGSW
jgi:hypothetical protein